MTELSDELLVAHVDGQLERDQSRAIEQVLDSDAVSARRAKALKAAHQRLETAFDALLAGEFTALTGATLPDATSVADTDPDTAPAYRRSGLLVTGIACLALGAAIGYSWRAATPPETRTHMVHDPVITSAIEPGDETGDQARAQDDALHPDAGAGGASWRDDVSRAYALYGRDWLEVSLESQANLEFVRFQLSALLGAPVAIPDLSGDGFTFKRADILRSDDEPVAQIAYLPERGAPLALYAKPDDVGPAAGPSLHASEGIAMAAWTEGGFSYLLAGRVSEPRLRDLTAAVRAQIAEE